MKNSLVLTTATLISIALSAPVSDGTAVRFLPHIADSSSAGNSDINILSYALALEHLEVAFYTSGLKKFTASDLNPERYENVQRLLRDETTHVEAISAVLKSLGQEVLEPCQYNFPYSTPQEFLNLAAQVEGLGVSAYAGASSSIHDSKILLTAASILPVEARHGAVLRIAAGVPPYASPFDTPLDFNQVWSLASQFIVPGSCPKSARNLGLTAFAPLSLTKGDNATVTAITPGSTVTFKADLDSKASVQPRHASHQGFHEKYARNVAHHSSPLSVREEAAKAGLFAAFLMNGGATIMETKRDGDMFITEVPAGMNGQVYVILVKSKSDVKDQNTVAGPAIVEVADSVGEGNATPVPMLIPIEGEGSIGVDTEVTVAIGEDQSEGESDDVVKC